MNTKEREYVYYDGILSKEECIKVGLIISKFEEGKISYEQLEVEFSNLGISLVPLLKDARMLYKMEEIKKYAEHSINSNIYAMDIDGYILSSSDYQNVLVRYDRYMVEYLADYGDERATKLLNELDRLETSSRGKKK